MGNGRNVVIVDRDGRGNGLAISTIREKIEKLRKNIGKIIKEIYVLLERFF